MTIIDRHPDIIGPPPGEHPSEQAAVSGAPEIDRGTGARRYRPAIGRSGWITAAIGSLAAVLYCWNLSINGYANDYYAAAAKAGSVSWKAMFFGSLDAGSFITVDKPPAALWLQSLSARIFGFNSWSMLLPEAIAGVVSVLILHKLVRRWAGDVAAHLAALAFAVTPVAVVMFRFNNPDALLTALGLGAAWAMWSALESGRTRGLVVAAALTGLAFNTKMLQAYLVLPAFILVYLVAGKPAFWKRIAQLGAALVTLVVASSWWVVIVALWPTDDRPYIGSTSDNSIWSLVFGYNGFGRIFGQGRGASGASGTSAVVGTTGAPAGGGGANFGGEVGWLRLFNELNGGQIAWFIPLAALGAIAGLWLSRSAPRTDLTRAGWLLWGGWAATCLAVFSLAQGIYHPYYAVQMAPAVAALAGAGAPALWQVGRRHRWLGWALPAAVLVSAAWSLAILGRTPDHVPWLRGAVVGGAVVAVTGLWLGGRLRHRTLVAVAAAVAACTLLAGPTAYAVSTLGTSLSGAVVSGGPAATRTAGPALDGGAPDGAATVPAGGAATVPADGPTGAGPDGGRAADGRGATTTDPALVRYLEANKGTATYIVAAFGSHSSSSIIVATAEPVMTIGGFNGADPAPTLDQFTAMVDAGEVRFVLVSSGGPGGGMGGGPGGGMGGPGGNSGSGTSISAWVTANGSIVDPAAWGATTAAGTLYDLAPVT